MPPGNVLKDVLLASLPSEWPVDLLPEIQALVQASGRKVVVLDDDPTGTQTVHGIPVLTHWRVPALCQELCAATPAFYILTNSRSLEPTQAEAMNFEIGRNLHEAARKTGQEFTVVSRSDSTLRGHFPGEVQALTAALETSFDGYLLIPFFLEGGRFTIGDTHYVADGKFLIPSGETEYAKDAVFGYHASDLGQWVEEKTGGRISAPEVASISIEDIRVGGPDRVARQLLELKTGQFCIVNAASYRDLEVFVLALLSAEGQGRRYIYRTAASFVRVRAGIAPQDLLASTQLEVDGNAGGLIVVGSYVPRTTSQLNALRLKSDLLAIEIDVNRLLQNESRLGEISRVARQAEGGLQNGRDVVVFTSRELLHTGEGQGDLWVGKRISEGLVAVLNSIHLRPRYILAKGGITASDLATAGLGVERAVVLGQLLPGVPVWQLGAESRFPGLCYIVFPGNVGGTSALADVAAMLAPGD